MLRQMKESVQEKFVSKLVAYLRGDATSVTSPKDFMACISQVAEVCDQIDGSRILRIIEEFIKDYIQEDLKPRLMDIHGIELLENLSKIWGQICIYAISFDRLFAYINRTFLANMTRPKISHQIMLNFKAEIFDKIVQRITQTILDQINLERGGTAINRDAVRTCIQVYSDLGLEKPIPRRVDGRFIWEGKMNLAVYNQFFEADFLADVRQQAKSYATRWNSLLNCPEFLREVHRFI